MEPVSLLPGVLTLLWYSSSALLSCSNSCLNVDAFSPSDFDILLNCIFAVWSRRLGKGGEGWKEEGEGREEERKEKGRDGGREEEGEGKRERRGMEANSVTLLSSSGDSRSPNEQVPE